MWEVEEEAHLDGVISLFPYVPHANKPLKNLVNSYYSYPTISWIEVGFKSNCFSSWLTYCQGETFILGESWKQAPKKKVIFKSFVLFKYISQTVHLSPR